MTPQQIIDEAIAQVQRGWTRADRDDMSDGSSAFTADGRGTWHGDPEAVRMCLGSALLRAARAPACYAPDLPPGVPCEPEDFPAIEEHDAAVRAVSAECRPLSYGEFNDTRERADVLGALERARMRV